MWKRVNLPLGLPADLRYSVAGTIYVVGRFFLEAERVAKGREWRNPTAVLQRNVLGRPWWYASIEVADDVELGVAG